MRDLFPETLHHETRLDDDEAREMALGLITDWFGTLSYAHSRATHDEIIESLGWPGMRDFVTAAGLAIDGRVVDFDEFAAGVRRQARLAERAGLVVQDGKPRKRRAERASVGDLFGGVAV